jgi:pimeloyl-ACP methyl ester carboxylesterase
MLILAGSFFANLVRTGGGNIEIHDVRFMGSTYSGSPSAPTKEPKHIQMSALLYIPKGVSAENKAPGIVAIHGYYDSRETQDGFAIEFARRGYVVLAVDQTGHGYSDPPAFANGFGGIDALKYLRSLDFVDTDNIGIEGHSMGGWSALIAATVMPDAYQSLILASSATGMPMFGVQPGKPTFPRNIALLYSKYDEFSGSFWQSPIPANMVNTEKVQKIFNTTDTIEIGKLYGSIEDGTARKFYMPAMIHPRVHFSREAIGNAAEWMQTTLKGGNDLPPDDQVWLWKEIFTFMALIGMVMLIFSLGEYLLARPYFKELEETPRPAKSLSGGGWWIGAIIMVVIPLVVYYYAWDILFSNPGISKAQFIWPQQLTNIIMFWAIVVAIISLVLFVLWHQLSNKAKGATPADYGLAWKNTGLQWRIIGKSFFFALIIVFWAHLTLVVVDRLFKVDYRLWVLAIKPLDSLRFGICLGYIIPFGCYFLILGFVLHGQMRPGRDDIPLSIAKETGINVLLLISGYILFLLVQYIPIFTGGTLAFPEFTLGAIFLFQIIPVFAIVAIISTYFYSKTGHIYVGAFLSAMLVTWIIVASQVIHYTY